MQFKTCKISVFLCVTCSPAGSLGSLSSICTTFVLCWESEKLDQCFICSLLVTFLQPKRTTYLHTYGRKSVYVSTPSLRSLDVCWYLWPCLTTPFHYTCTPTVLAKYISVGQSGVCKKIPSKLLRSVCIRLKPVSPLTNLGQYHVRIGV